MKALEYIGRTREYLNYLEEHITNVQRAFEEVKGKCKDLRVIYDDYCYWELESAVDHHDLSKISKEEFVQYREKFFPVEGETGSDFNSAWENHKKENAHHWENWTQRDMFNPYEWEVNCTHMVIDWLAMGYKFNDTPRAYFEKNKDRIVLPEHAIRFIYEIFERLETR